MSNSPNFEPSQGRRASRKSKEFRIECILCQNDNASESTPTLVTMMPYLQELTRYKQMQYEAAEDSSPMDFLIIDLRQNKAGGLLPKSHQIDLTKGLDETINYLINDFIEFQSKFHFVFMTTNFSSWLFKESQEGKNLKSKRSTKETLKSERSSIKCK